MTFNFKRTQLFFFSFLAIAITGLTTNIVNSQETESPIDQGKIESPTNKANANDSKQLKTIIAHNSPVYGLVFHPTEAVLISVGSYNDPTMRFWDTKNGTEISHVRVNNTAISGLAISPDGSMVANGGLGSALSIWDTATKKCISTFLLHANSILALAITPDGNILVSGGLDGIRVWNLVTKRPLYTLAGVGNSSYGLAIHPNGYLLASGDAMGNIQLWNIRTGKLVSQFSAHKQTITGLVFTPDGKSLISSAKENTVKIWDVNTRKLSKELKGHQDMVLAIALNKSGTKLASGGKDGLKFWDLSLNDSLIGSQNTNDWIKSLAFSPDGNTLAMGLYNNEIQILPTP